MFLTGVYIRGVVLVKQQIFLKGKIIRGLRSIILVWKMWQGYLGQIDLIPHTLKPVGKRNCLS